MRSRASKKLALMVLVIITHDSLAQTVDSGLSRFVSSYEDTWQSHDAERLGAYFTEDADMIMGSQPRIYGRTAIERWWNLYFSRIDTTRVISISVESVRLLSVDVALVNVATTTGGTHSKTQAVLEDRRARGTWVVTRAGKDWQIAALRAHSPVGEQRQGPGTDN